MRRMTLSDWSLFTFVALYLGLLPLETELKLLQALCSLACGIKLICGARNVTVTLIGHAGIKVHVLYDFCADGGTSDNRF